MRAAILTGALVVLGGCVDHKAPLSGTNSIKIELKGPNDLGTATRRIDNTVANRTVVADFTALDQDGNPDTTFGNDLQVYVHYLGTLSPYLGGTPLATVHMSAGKASNVTINLPPVFGPTNLWVDDSEDQAPTYATGASDPLWFRDPWIRDIQTPASETALDALSASPLETKNIDVSTSAYGDEGLLVVSSSFAQGYTLSDMHCPGGHAPCTTAPYDSVMVFSFSAPQFTDEHGQTLVAEGQVLSRFNGGVEEFNGLTEIGFPQTFAKFDASNNAIVDPALEPTPVVFSTSWFGPLSDPNGQINFERYEAAPIEVDNAVVCQLDDDYTTYKQWKIDPNGTPSASGTSCKSNHNVLNVITSGTIADFDPTTLVGKKLPKLVGVLRPVSIGTFNVWILYPRKSADITLP